MEQPEQNIVTGLQQSETAAPPQAQSAPEPHAQSAPEPQAYSEPGSTVFDAEKVSCYYGSFRAVTDVSLSVYENEITAFIGPSGCGKTTVLRTLNRMNDLVPGAHVEGDVRYRGASLYGKGVSPIAVRRNIGMVFQKPNPFPKSIYYNVEPDVVLMDEPCSALDPIATSAIEDLMRDIKSRYTIVIVTHNMQQATRVSDRTAFFSVLRNEESDTRTGVLVEYGRTQQIFEDPKDPRTEAYVTGQVG